MTTAYPLTGSFKVLEPIPALPGHHQVAQIGILAACYYHSLINSGLQVQQPDLLGEVRFLLCLVLVDV